MRRSSLRGLLISLICAIGVNPSLIKAGGQSYPVTQKIEAHIAHSRKRLRLFRASIFLLACVAGDIEGAIAQRPYFVQTTDRTLIKIDMQDANRLLHFSIPKAYLDSSSDWRGGLQYLIR